MGRAGLERPKEEARLVVQIEQVGVVFANVGLCVGDELSHVPAGQRNGYCGAAREAAAARLEDSYSQMKLP